MTILHVVPGLEEGSNGIAVAAKLIAVEQGADLVEAQVFAWGEGGLEGYDEVWVHSCWLPMTLKSCWRVLRAGKPLVRMTHANLDPVRLRYHGWKKWLVGPIERFCLRRAKTLVATCDAEADWIRSYLGNQCPPIIITDIRRFFQLPTPNSQLTTHNSQLHLLYLGRRHPLKGLDNLLAALRQFAPNIQVPSENIGQTYILTSESASPKCSKDIELKVVSNAFGDELEKVWDWSDVLILPTLSDNFGLVIAEALERGKRVITTDGAPAWGDGNDYGGRLTYIKGYRDGSPEQRIRLLHDALLKLNHEDGHCLYR